MKFRCVTPCLNSEKFIEETMLSVLTQSVLDKKNNFLFYTIVDGGSVDSTIEIIERTIAQFSSKKNMRISYFSEKDSGMYDALAKGFENEINSSDVYSYINAGDYYSKYAFDVVSEIFADNDIHFITGINSWYNEKSHLTDFFLPFSYNKNLLLKGFYGKILPFIQQESTFWSNKSHKKINFNKLRELRLAGDYYLWKTFISDTPLYIVSAWLGGFKNHGGQLSSRFRDKYYEEVKSLSSEPKVFDYMLAYAYKIIGHFPNELKKKLSSHIFEYNNVQQAYRLTNHSSRRLRRR